MTELEQLFQQRNELYETLTQTIFDSINPVLDGSAEFLASVPSGEFANGDIMWNGIELVDGHVMLVGSFSHRIGSSVMVKDESIEITDANAAYFIRTIRIGIPAELSATEDKEEVIQFLKELYEANDDQEVESLISTLSEISKSEEQDDQEFDFDELSDDQKLNLHTDNKGTFS